MKIETFRHDLGDQPPETGNQHVRDTTKPLTCLYTMRVWVLQNNKRGLIPESYLSKRKCSREIPRLQGMQNMEAFCECIDHHGWWSPRGRMDDVLPCIHVWLHVSSGLSLKTCLNPSIFHIAVKSREINIFSSFFKRKLRFFSLSYSRALNARKQSWKMVGYT